MKGTKPSHSLKEYTGRFSNQAYGPFDVTLSNDSLYAKFKILKVWLRHKHYDIFDAIPVTKTGIDTTNTLGPLFNFSSNESGEISKVSLKIEAMLDPMDFKRQDIVTNVDKTALTDYVGEYEIPGMTVRVFIKGENKLILFVPGQPEYELLPTGKNKFSLKQLEGFKLEFLEVDNHVNELMLIQPNGTFKAKKKNVPASK